ncbi:hypothetical protein HLB44_34090 [Aquincola sp. S2]|uniref:Peptidase M61 catalytic domain-containing protein n=1 Tax=Pseudaquabacterium terrae TaxID=2732868 RepID=A0ABX2ETQ4_9BURK|nr:hypothetical protein [Aquabacterium terrae]NRF72028.1 hypothetical protein [Aquabacterium terrae]
MPFVVVRLFAVLALLLSLAITAQAATPSGCEVFWQLTPRWADSGAATQLDLRLAVDGGPLVPQPLADDPALMIGARQLAFAGRALLMLPPALAGRATLQMCLQVDGLSPDQRLFSSLHPAPGDDRLLRWQGPPALAREIVIAAGSWQLRERIAEGQALRIVLPTDGAGSANVADAVADAAVRVVTAQRRFWGATETPRSTWLVTLAANDNGSPAGAIGLHDALLLRLPSGAQAIEPVIETLLAQAALRNWFRERFGPVAFAPRGDEAASAWFSEGFSLFYALRLRAADGSGSLDGLAAALTMLWNQPGTNPAALPWLAAHWHSALQARGHAGGLDAVLHRLQLPPAARRDDGGPFGPLSQPLAVHRLQAAVRPLLGESMRADLLHFIGPGAAPSRSTLGPCFELDVAARRISAARDAASSAACQAWLGVGRSAAAAAAANAQPPKAAAGKNAAASSKATKAAPKRRKR